MRAFLYREAKAAELPFVEGAAHHGEAELVWLHLDGREAGASAWLEAQQDIPELARQALMASETRPRSDIMGQGAIINLRGLGKTPEDDPDALVSMRFWVEQGRVVSLTMRSPFALDEVIDRFLGGEVRDPGDLVVAFADAITDELDPDIAAMGDLLDEAETRMESEAIHLMRRQVSRTRNQAIAYRRFMAPQRAALERLASSELDCLDAHDLLHLREAADRAARMSEELEAIRERAALMHEELTDMRAEQMDGRALLLSIVALVFLPLTFLTGLLGMNVKGIPWADEPLAFWGVTGVCAAIALGLALWFARAHWLSR